MKSILALVLMAVSVFLSVKHGWEGLNIEKNPAQQKMAEELNVDPSVFPYFAVAQFVLAIMLVIPRTFFLANLVNALMIVLLMAVFLRAGNVKMALIEIPFLALPLLLIFLKYPFVKH